MLRSPCPTDTRQLESINHLSCFLWPYQTYSSPLCLQDPRAGGLRYVRDGIRRTLCVAHHACQLGTRDELRSKVGLFLMDRGCDGSGAADSSSSCFFHAEIGSNEGRVEAQLRYERLLKLWLRGPDKVRQGLSGLRILARTSVLAVEFRTPPPLENILVGVLGLHLPRSVTVKFCG